MGKESNMEVTKGRSNLQHATGITWSSLNLRFGSARSDLIFDVIIGCPTKARTSTNRRRRTDCKDTHSLLHILALLHDRGTVRSSSTSHHCETPRGAARELGPAASAMSATILPTFATLPVELRQIVLFYVLKQDDEVLRWHRYAPDRGRLRIAFQPLTINQQFLLQVEQRHQDTASSEPYGL